MVIPEKYKELFNELYEEVFKDYCRFYCTKEIDLQKAQDEILMITLDRLQHTIKYQNKKD